MAPVCAGVPTASPRLGNTGCTTALWGMILAGCLACGSESCCLSGGLAQLRWRGVAGWPELAPAAAGVLAAQGYDVGGAFGGPVHACLLGALDDDRLDASFDGARAGEHAQVAEVLVAHPVGVALEVAEFTVQFLGLDAGERVAGSGIDDGGDVPGVQLLAAPGQPLLRVGGDE